MQHFTDAQIEAAVSPDEAFEVIRDVYQQRAQGNTALQPRHRISIGGKKFSAMAAMLEGERIAAIKFYATLENRFHFHVALVSLDDGRLLALMEGDALTRLRTAATTTLAATLLANPKSRTLGLIGAGVQGGAHARALASKFRLERIVIHDPNEALASRLSTSLCAPGLAVLTGTAEEAARNEVVVAATRSSTPVLRGEWLLPGAFVASIGATRPNHRELDDACIARASRVVVDASEQTVGESGDFQLLAPDLLASAHIVDLSDIVASPSLGHPGSGHVIYKAVGNALQDAALAALAFRKIGTKMRAP